MTNSPASSQTCGIRIPRYRLQGSVQHVPQVIAMMNQVWEAAAYHLWEVEETKTILGETKALTGHTYKNLIVPPSFRRPKRPS